MRCPRAPGFTLNGGHDTSRDAVRTCNRDPSGARREVRVTIDAHRTLPSACWRGTHKSSRRSFTSERDGLHAAKVRRSTRRNCADAPGSRTISPPSSSHAPFPCSCSGWRSAAFLTATQSAHLRVGLANEAAAPTAGARAKLELRGGPAFSEPADSIERKTCSTVIVSRRGSSPDARGRRDVFNVATRFLGGARRVAAC